MATQLPSRGPLRASHLRQVSTGSTSAAAEVGRLSNARVADIDKLGERPHGSTFQRSYVLSMHDENVFKQDVVLIVSPTHDIHDGDLLRLSFLGSSDPQQDRDVPGCIDPSRSLHFLFANVSQEVLSKQPGTQVSVSRRIASAFGFEKGNHVLVTAADRSTCQASHVEIVFRDQYLARADMWHLVVSELANSCIYRGQKLEFMGTIRAFVKTIFVQGRKVQSAFFHPSTKPVFRSESARYVLFIQMSKEMWQFDAEGSGEIMFDKVINGFLPELFQRWHELKVRHLVSIVLFTRMIYEEHTGSETGVSKFECSQDCAPTDDNQGTSKDFYRVVVSDMASGEWADILSQLKREFRVFLKDISIRKPDTGDHLPLGEGLSSALEDTPSYVIAGHPSTAGRGNLLEAINLASSQFSSDYIDRDLVRTGVSIVVISPGTGVFEVDYNLLVATTENLIDNGVGIDLVCLSRMPLHSVPIFKYYCPPAVLAGQGSASRASAGQEENTPTGSFTASVASETLAASPIVGDNAHGSHDGIPRRTWNYGIPHWVDISFWTSSLDEGVSQSVPQRKPKEKSSFDTPQHKTFVPRVKMYELQMMGVMENAVGDISIPRLSHSFCPLASQHLGAMLIGMSGSPKNVSTLSASNSFDSQIHRAPYPSAILSASWRSDRPIHEKATSAQLRWMDDYDESVFRHPEMVKRRPYALESLGLSSRSRQQFRQSLSLSGGSEVRQQSPFKSRSSAKGRNHGGREKLKRPPFPAKRAAQAIKEHKSNSVESIPLRPDNNTRKISFGPRGFSAKAIASTELTTQHGEGSLLSRGLKSGLAKRPGGLTKDTLSSGRKQSDQLSSKDANVNVRTSVFPQTIPPSEPVSQQARPIPIRNPTAIRIAGDSKDTAGDRQHMVNCSHKHDRLASLKDIREQEDTSKIEPDIAESAEEKPAALSRSTTLAPWLTVLNPSNPPRVKETLAGRLGRWQHIFPRPLKTSYIKWKSLCSPAAVPLTTEDFPTAEQLANEYEEVTYEVDLPKDSELSETPRSLVNEILAFRLSRGFQFVVGSHVMEDTKVPPSALLNVFDDQILAEIGSSVFLSRGSMIHVISRLGASALHVKQLIRYGAEKVGYDETDCPIYKPFIRSMLGHDYEPQSISIAPHRSNFDWKMIDFFIAGHERPQAQAFVANLRPWRARFVLIPVEASSSARRRRRTGEDDEEEIRLEGIRKLTQVWQRFRYIPPEERRYQAPLRNRKDTNPLDILYQTRNPSAIIAAELENLAEGDATRKPVQLLPESDLYQRSNFKIAGLAETIQSEKGVRMLDRRWHLRLHYNCFIGFELTSWLFQNFRDVDSRDEAVDLGNELLKSGLFKHVEQRHNFRDGNYFYQIADEYRTPRPESKGWFSRGKTSVASTPMSEDGPREYSLAGRPPSSSSSKTPEEHDPTTPTGKKKQLGVALSKSLIYDVDHRKRSYRPELINLHYDRLHNPDNCYHIRVEWMNTTPKLIQDAVVSWATLVERFGLRLVEIPLGEASSITSIHPFRAPYSIKLAQPPPPEQPQSYFDSTSFNPQPRTEKHFYQKAILKRFNFVLDFEAASDFPADVDVAYSWGRPDYRFPQYIHRSGMLIAQITEEGHLLLLANRLYNNRSGAASTTHNEANKPDSDPNRGLGILRSSPHRGNHGPSHPSPRSSPYNSPSVRATLDVPPSSSPRGPTSTSTLPKIIDTTHSTYANSEATTRDLETFCNDIDSLKLFYEELLSKAPTPGPNTPFMAAGKTPNHGPEMGGFNENSIPTLALPGSVVEKRGGGAGDGKKEDARTRAVGGGSPRAGGAP